DEVIGDGAQRDADRLQLCQRRLRLIEVALQAAARLAVVTEGGQRLDGHRVDRLGADQLLVLHHVAVARVLRPGVRPQQALMLGRAITSQRLRASDTVALVSSATPGDTSTLT